MGTETAVDSVDGASLIAAINARHGTQFTLGTRCGEGEQGAYALTDGVDGRYALKCGMNGEAFAKAAVTTECLSRAGYPAPRYRYSGEAAGIAYAVLDALPGEPLTLPTVSLLPQLFALNSLQVGQARGGRRDWPQILIETTLYGDKDNGDPDTLRAYSTETAALLVRCQDAARVAVGVPCMTSDIVHFAFNPANILITDGQISGIVDWEGTCAGDCAFDLATLLFFSYDVMPIRSTLAVHLRQRLDAPIAALYFAHLIVRQLDRAIRSHETASVAHWLTRARAIAPDFLP